MKKGMGFSVNLLPRRIISAVLLCSLCCGVGASGSDSCSRVGSPLRLDSGSTGHLVTVLRSEFSGLQCGSISDMIGSVSARVGCFFRSDMVFVACAEHASRRHIVCLKNDRKPPAIPDWDHFRVLGRGFERAAGSALKSILVAIVSNPGSFVVEIESTIQEGTAFDQPVIYARIPLLGTIDVFGQHLCDVSDLDMKVVAVSVAHQYSAKQLLLTDTVRIPMFVTQERALCFPTFFPVMQHPRLPHRGAPVALTMGDYNEFAAGSVFSSILAFRPERPLVSVVEDVSPLVFLAHSNHVLARLLALQSGLLAVTAPISDFQRTLGELSSVSFAELEVRLDFEGPVLVKDQFVRDVQLVRAAQARMLSFRDRLSELVAPTDKVIAIGTQLFDLCLTELRFVGNEEDIRLQLDVPTVSEKMVRVAGSIGMVRRLLSGSRSPNYNYAHIEPVVDEFLHLAELCEPALPERYRLSALVDRQLILLEKDLKHISVVENLVEPFEDAYARVKRKIDRFFALDGGAKSIARQALSEGEKAAGFLSSSIRDMTAGMEELRNAQKQAAEAVVVKLDSISLRAYSLKEYQSLVDQYNNCLADVAELCNKQIFPSFHSVLALHAQITEAVSGLYERGVVYEITKLRAEGIFASAAKIKSSNEESGALKASVGAQWNGIADQVVTLENLRKEARELVEPYLAGSQGKK